MNSIVDRYDADAADYARYWAPVLERTAGRLVDHVADFVARRDGRVRVLDVGAGTGTLSLAMLERWPHAEIVITDPAAGMLELARARAAESGLGGDRVSFLIGAADALPVDAAAADLVVSSFVLQLVPDRPAALREAFRILRPGGMLGYLTWLDRDSRRPFRPGEEFDEAVYDLGIDEPEPSVEQHAGDVPSGRAAADELRRAGFFRASGREEELVYEWTIEAYLAYKLAYDESSLVSLLNAEQRAELERNARSRLSRLAPADFRWHAPVVFGRAVRPA